MTSQFENYVPIQGLVGRGAPGINSTETMSESVVVTVT